MNSQCDEVERILWKSRRKEREVNAERTKRSLDVKEVPLPEALPARQTGKDTESENCYSGKWYTTASFVSR